MISEDGRYVTEEDYWENYYEHLDFNYEWNNGILEEKPVGDFQDLEMYKWFTLILQHYCLSQKTGKLVVHDFGFRLKLPDKVTIRKPDVAVVLNANQSPLALRDRSFKGIYDLCVEFVSDLTRQAVVRDTVNKKLEYEAIGVKEYYILDGDDTYTAFYRLNSSGIFEHITPIKGDIIQSEVLEGFQFRISDLFKQPDMEDLTEDEVYYHYLFPLHRVVKEKFFEEKQRADAEKLRADMALKEVERLAMKLRSLGIPID
jgi:Uma2 family endonuclease